MIGTTLAHYRITAALGAGGMGEVWRATDEKLGRDVALKVLPEEFADDAGRLDRFEREARAVASLNHPHIVTIYSVEDADGIRFLTMELVEGNTLDGMIPEGGFDLATFFDLATPLAEAISAAHDKSVIHRDLKPANVMVDGEGRVKVMDFGLAKLQETTDPSDSSELPTEALTGVGTIVGTVPYMSPEQIEGLVVDHRTDIFSLGVLLYEMAIGERPFKGSSSPALMSSILKDVPSSVVEIRDDLPRHLARIIGRCLEKDRRDRYQTARDVFNELKALRRESTATGHSRSPVVPPPPSAQQAPTSSSQIRHSDVPWIAVLPLGCPTGDSEIERFADGLEEDIASGLSRFSYLFVVARKSTRRYRGEATDVRQVGEELGARYVMEGSVRRAGSRIRLGMNLIDASTGTHLWSETYDRDLEAADVFDLQDELTDRVVATVADPHGALTRSMAIETDSKAPESLTSHEAVLRLFLYRQRVSAEDHLVTRTALEHAAERDPNNAEVLAALAGLCIEEANHDFNPRPDPLDRALAIARRAVEADPSSQLAHFYLAQAYFHSQNLSGFRAAADRALELNRRSTDTMAMLGILFGYAGDFEKGIELAGKAMELNPLHPGWYRFSPFMNAYLQGRDAEALEIAQQINMPEYWGDPLARTVAHGQLGNRRAAEAAARDLLRVWPDFEKDYKRVGLDPWVYAVPELEARIVDGLAKAGLKVLGAERPQVESTGEEKTGSEPERGPVAIAVLPFVNMSADPENEYFSDGLTEELIADLAGIKALSVISRTSAMLFKGTTKDLPAIGRELCVRYILEGSVRKSSSSLRVTAQLVDAEKDGTLWSEKFSGKVNDVFGIQEEIARKIVAALKVRLTDSEESRVVNRPIDNVVAFDCYLRARQEMYGWTPESLQRAALLVDQALGIVGENSLLLATRGQIEWNHANAMLDPDEGRLDEAADYARRALTLTPDDPLGLFLRGIVSGLRGDTLGALRDTLRAHQLRPRDSNILTEMCRFANASGIDVTDYISEMVRIDPLTPVTWSVVSFDHFVNGRIDEAVVPARRSLELASETSMVHIFSAWALAQAGLVDEAASILETAGRELAGTLHGTWALFLRYALDGDAERAGVQMTPLLERSACLNEHVARMIADGYSLIGRNDEALRWIRIAMKRGFINYPFLATYDPLLANVREDPRFEALMREVKARWERLAAAVPPPLCAISPANGG